MSYEEFLITDRGILLAEKLEVGYYCDGEVIIYHYPSGTILSKEFIENNNRIIEEELSRINRNIEDVEFAIEYKDCSYLDILKDMYELRSHVREHLYEFRELVNRMY